MIINLRQIFFIYILSLATAIQCLTDSGFNYLFIAVGCLFIGISIVKVKTSDILKELDLSILLLFLSMCISVIFNFDSFRVSTFLYSIFFITLFLFVKVSINHKVSFEYYFKCLKIIFVLFFIEVILEQISAITGIQVSVNLNSTDNLFTRLPSLSLEPSIGSAIVTFIFYAIQKYKSNKSLKNYLMWFMYLYMMFSFNSSFGIMYLLFVLSLFINKKYFYLFPIVIFLIFLLFTFVSLRSVDRLKAVVNVKEIKDVSSTDLSASVRILPSYFYVTSIKITDSHFYFGHGIDYAKKLYPKILPGVPKAMNLAGFLPNYMYDYGLICCLFFLALLRKYIFVSFFSFEFFIALITFTNANFNTQNFWLMIVIFYANRFYDEQKLINNESQN